MTRIIFRIFPNSHAIKNTDYLARASNSSLINHRKHFILSIIQLAVTRKLQLHHQKISSTLTDHQIAGNCAQQNNQSLPSIHINFNIQSRHCSRCLASRNVISALISFLKTQVIPRQLDTSLNKRGRLKRLQLCIEPCDTKAAQINALRCFLLDSLQPFRLGNPVEWFSVISNTFRA